MKKKYFLNANIIDPFNSIEEMGGLIVNENGIIEPLKFEFYYKKGKQDLIIFTGDVQAETAEGQYNVSNAVLQFIKNYNCIKVYTFGAFVTPNPSNPPKVYGTANSNKSLKQLSKSLALDLGKHGIRVNNIGPGYFKTKMTEKSWKNNKLRKARSQRTVLGRWGKPEDLAGIIICLCSESSSYITGQDIYVDGGWLIKGL